MAEFIKEFKYDEELLKIKSRKYKENEEEKSKRLKLAIYGLDGEERVNYQLKLNDLDILCYHNLRLKDDVEKIQVDFVVISNEYIFLIEVKNLYGNIRINKDRSVDRLVYKNTGMEVTSMTNPLFQIEEHISFMEKYLNKNGFNKKIEGILVMANDKTRIFVNSKDNNVIKYEYLNRYLKKFVKETKLTEDDYKLGDFFKNHDLPFSFNNFNQIGKSMINSYVPKFKTQDDYDLYVELVKLRKDISNRRGIALPYIYNNKEIEKLVESKPLTKEEFLNVSGFKTKRYNMFGKDVINIFKNFKK